MTTPSKYAGGSLDKLAADYEYFKPAYRLSSAENVITKLIATNPAYKGKTLGDLTAIFKSAFKRQNLGYGLRLYEGDIKERAAERRMKKSQQVEDRIAARKGSLEYTTEQSTDPGGLARDLGLPRILDND